MSTLLLIWIIGAIINYVIIYYLDVEYKDDIWEFWTKIALMTIMWPLIDIISIGLAIGNIIVHYMCDRK